MGGNEENDERSSEEEHQNEGRGRKLFRRLSDKFRLRSASSNTSPDVKRKPKLKSKTANDATLVSNDQKAKTTSGNTSATGTDSDFARTETPVNSANLDSDPVRFFFPVLFYSLHIFRKMSRLQAINHVPVRIGKAALQQVISRMLRNENASNAVQPRRMIYVCWRCVQTMQWLTILRQRPISRYNFVYLIMFLVTILSLWVRVRIIEAKELQGDDLSPLVRVHLGGKTRTTRSIRSTSNPRWDHTTDFSMRTSMENLAMLNCEFNVNL
jgi:hypothetical protein